MQNDAWSEPEPESSQQASGVRLPSPAFPPLRLSLGFAALLNMVVATAWGLSGDHTDLWWWTQELLFYGAAAGVAQWIAMTPFLLVGSFRRVKLTQSDWKECGWLAFFVSLVPILLGVEYSPPLLSFLFMIVWCPTVSAYLIMSWIDNRR